MFIKILIHQGSQRLYFFSMQILEIINTLYVIRTVFYLKKDKQNFKDILGA